MVTLSDLRAKVRQKTFASVCRIDFVDEKTLLHLLLARYNDLSKELAAGKAQRAADPISSPTLKPELVIGWCNETFRIRRNAEQLAAEGQNSKPLRIITRALESVDFLLKENSIECLDLAGQAYDAGRNDFSSIAEPEIVPGLDRMKIIRCERPAVWLNGELIQKARGIVARPA